MTSDSKVSRPEPRLPGRIRPRQVLLRRVLALFLLPFMVSGGVPVPRVSAQPLASPAQPPAQDTSAASGQTIRAIEMRGIQALSEETLLYYLGLQPGQTLDDAALNKKIKELWDRSLVDDIKVETEPAEGGVKLIITVKERPILRSIDYQGLKRISKTDIQDKLATQRIRLREGEPMSLGELERVNALIEEMYGEKGYRFAEARYAVEEVGPNEKKVIFTVDEGGRVRIAEIEFEGNTTYNDIHLQYLMRNTRQSGPITRILKKDIYDPAKLQEDLDRVRKLYRGAGYKNVVIGDPQLEVRATNPNAKPEEQKRRMFITIPIEEGERWKFGEITIEGNEIYTDQALLRAFKHRPNSWLRQKEVDDGVKAITDLYHNTGYIFARIDPELIEKPGQVADMVIHINESDQYKVGRIEFQGNDRTMDKVLRRELRLWEGGLVNIGAVRNSVLKVNQLGYFKLDEEDPVQIDTDTEKKEVNLVFKGEESDRTELQFGGGWSELDGFFGQFAINTKNFLGRGEQVGVSLQSGKYRDFFDLSYFIPWFLDRPQTIGVRLYNQDSNFGLEDDALEQRYLRNGRGGILTYGRNFRLFQSASVSYNLSQYQDKYSLVVPEPQPGDPPPGPNDPKPGDVISQEVSLNNSSLRPVYVFDSRDNPFEASRGQRISLAVEYAGGFLGGDSYFVRPEINYSLFRPTMNFPVRQVFALNVEGGLIDAFGGQDYPLQPYDRFFLGGENTIRGHRYKSIYLRDDQGNPLKDDQGFILGGDKFVQFNLEYHFLLGGPFRVLAFVDGGNVYGQGYNFDLSRLRYTAGAELRVLIPMFGAPLRFIYAKNLDPQPQDSFESFQFSIGSSF